MLYICSLSSFIINVLRVNVSAYKVNLVLEPIFAQDLDIGPHVHGVSFYLINLNF